MTDVGMAVATTSEEALHCFVCDVAVTGKHYTLATCRTQSTNIRLIEKLGQLVGERYMVVICEDDIICRGCANLINTLDRLETEMNSVRKVVLQFLEKKYALEEGELINNKSNYGLPPQITSRNLSPRSAMSENFMYQKRKAALMELENECNSGLTDQNKKANSKNDVWMQCDKCKYTTHYNAFMIHHVRQHVKRKQKFVCEFCGSRTDSSDGLCPQNCCMKNNTNSFATGSPVEQSGQSVDIDDAKQSNKKENSSRKRSDSEAETVEMIAAEINEFTGGNRSRSELVIPNVQESSSNASITEIGTNSKLITKCENQQSSSCVNSRESLATSLVRNEEMIIPVTEMTREQVQQQIAAGNLEVQMEGQEVGSTPTAICVMEMSEDHAPESTLVTVQKMEDDNNAVYVQVVEVGKDGDIDETSNIPKVLTVSDDGTVEMVEVMWDDMVPTDVEPGQTLQF